MHGNLLHTQVLIRIDMRQVTDVCLRVTQQHGEHVPSACHVITGFYLRPRRMRRARPGEREESSLCSFTPGPGQRRSPRAYGFSGPTP
jgi:hypothetical protein